jgi:ABC-type glycerol-3-phosphate transport system substrate-binding protein
MVMQGVWMANYIHNSAPNLDWDAAPFPHPDDHPELANSTVAVSDVIVIPTGARHPREAWEFIRYLQSQEGMELLCSLQWKHSPLRHVSPEFYRGHRNKHVKLFYDLAAGPNAFSWPRSGIWKELQDEMKTAFEKLWWQGASPQSAFQYVDDRMQPKLTAYLKSLERRSAQP